MEQTKQTSRNINTYPELQKSIKSVINYGFILLVLTSIILPLLGFLCNLIPVALILTVIIDCIIYISIRNKVNAKKYKRINNLKRDLVSSYGQISIVLSNDLLETYVFIFEDSKKIILNGKCYDFHEIIDFSINNMESYQTSISTGTVISRSIMGGITFGEIGALVGANTASSTTIKKTIGFKFNIILNNLSEPNVSLVLSDEHKAHKLSAILKIIIDRNIKNKIND